uniref:Apple domain-containing protein n=1 Tax=Plectus sambesii TaxID=2011161 RepID=A0A914WDU1_9BILA
MLPNCVAYFFWIFIVHHVYSATDVLSCFEKTPDHALIGYAQDTGNNQVGSLEECLGQCLDAEKKFQFECKSALFYPDLKECNLNTATKVDDSFSFVETAVGEKVDYYQKTCGVG